MVFTTHRKKPKNKYSIFGDSIGNSRLSSIEQELGLTGLFDGIVYHLSFDCPKPLALALKKATHDNGTSICKELQAFALSYVVKDHIEKSAFGNTLSKVLDPHLTIENLNFEQYVQSRPRRLVRHVEPQVVTVDCEVKCGFVDCREAAVGKGVFLQNGKEYPLCSVHLLEAQGKPRDWRVLPEVKS